MLGIYNDLELKFKKMANDIALTKETNHISRQCREDIEIYSNIQICVYKYMEI